MAAIEELQKQNSPKLDSEEDLKKLAGTGANLNEKKGRELYVAKCAVCHGPELQGSIGPNLTDEFWLHGQGKLADIAKIIRIGVPDKGMPGWDTQLNNEDIQLLAVFVASTQGTQPVNAKGPQGNKSGN